MGPVGRASWGGHFLEKYGWPGAYCPLRSKVTSVDTCWSVKGDPTSGVDFLGFYPLSKSGRIIPSSNWHLAFFGPGEAHPTLDPLLETPKMHV